MDIHKPKPVRNWREFLTEVGIIVLGVSIALAAEQAAAAWHEHRQYLDARTAIRAELETNIANIMRRGEFAACIGHRLDEVGSLLDKAESHETFDAPRWIGPAQSMRLRFASEPEVGKSDLFSTAETREYSRTYSYLHSLDVEQDRERLAWGRLQMLEGRSRLTPEMIPVLRIALTDARFEFDRIGFISAGTFAAGEQIGLGHDPDAVQVVRTFLVRKWPHCIPMNTPKAEAVQLSVGRYANAAAR